MALDEIESEADYVLLSHWRQILSEHFTLGEARVAYFKAAASENLGAQLPVIFARQSDHWIPLQ
jgi:hypothetical protein